MAMTSDLESCVMSTGGRELGAGTGFGGISDIAQLLHLGQRLFHIYKVCCKADV